MDGTNFAPDVNPLEERLAEQYADLRGRAAELVAALDRVPETVDDANAPKVSAFVKQIKECGKRVEEARKNEGEDFLRAKRTVDSFFAGIADTLKKAAQTVETRLNAYLQAKAAEERRRRDEEARRLAEEAARKAAEMNAEEDLDAAVAAEAAARQAQRQAEAKAADMARTHGGLGSVATLRTSVGFQVTNGTDAARALASYFDGLAVEKAVRAFIAANRDDLRRQVKAGEQPVAGVRFFEEQKALVR